jgi:hypothetical protein
MGRDMEGGSCEKLEILARRRRDPAAEEINQA